MKTTLKGAMGRGASVHGDGRPIYPPALPTPMSRYRQPDPPRRGAWAVVRAVLLWTVLATLIIAGGAAGAAYLKTHQFLEAISPKKKADIAAAKHLDVAEPGQPTVALVIGTDRRKGFQAEETGRSDTLNLWPGYQRLNATNALAYVRYRHFDSDLYRNARQQLFLKALKQQISSQLDLSTLFSIVDAVEKNVVVGRGGGKALDPQTLKDYLYFAHGLPAGHIFQSRIEGLTGYAELSAPPDAIPNAVRNFVQPDVKSPEKARDVAFGIKHRSHAPKPANVPTAVLNGNGIAGSAANAAYELGQRGYKIVLPATGTPQNAQIGR